MEKFNHKYRSDSLRLQGYDYSLAGLYFVTICTKNRVSYFGSIANGIMKLSPTGKVVAEEWKKTETIRPRVQLGEWVVMPNHVHGIIYLNPKESNNNRRDTSHVSQDKLDSPARDGYNPSLHEGKNNHDYKNEFGPQKNNISSIVRGFKSVCTKRIHKSGNKDFSWQSGFYDHIIRNQKSLIQIEHYIRENPYRWHQDRYYS